MMTSLLSGLVTQADLDDYERDGAIVVRKAVSPEWVEKLRAAVPDAIEGMLKFKDAMGIERPSGPTHHDVLHLFKKDPFWKEFETVSRLPVLAADITGADKVIIFGDHLLVKEPGCRKDTPWHNDLPYWPIRGNQMTSIWVALDPVTLETGALEYVAGSHKWNKMFAPIGFDDGKPIPGGVLEKLPDISENRGQYKIISWNLEPGDVLVHHPLVVHGAGVNESEHVSRRALSIRYVGGNTEFVGSNLFGGNEGPFALPLEVGEPVDARGVHPVVWER